MIMTSPTGTKGATGGKRSTQVSQKIAPTANRTRDNCLEGSYFTTKLLMLLITFNGCTFPIILGSVVEFRAKLRQAIHVSNSKTKSGCGVIYFIDIIIIIATVKAASE